MSLSDETGVSSRQGLRRAPFGAGDGHSDCEGGDGRCTAYGPTIRRGGAADDPGARPRADAATAVMVVTVAITSAGTAPAEGMRTPRTRASGTPRGPGGPGEFPRGAAVPAADVRRWDGPDSATRAGPGVRGIRRRFRARLGLREPRAVHGRLRAERRRGHRGGLLLPLRPQPPQPLSTRVAAVRALLGHGLAGQRSLGVVRGRPRPPGPEPQLRRSLLPLLRSARHRRTARASQEARDQGRLDLPGARLLADRRIPAHAVLESRARPGGEVRRAERRAHRARWRTRCSTSPWSAWCSRCTSGARR